MCHRIEAIVHSEKAGFRVHSSRISLSGRIYYEVTSRCNLRCTHCFGDFRGTGRDLDVDRVLAFHGPLSALGVEEVVLTGGEPTLHPRFERFLDLLTGHGRIVVTSNGTALEAEEYVRLLGPRPRLFFQLSLDGISPESFERVRGRGTLLRIMKVMEALADSGLSRQVSLSVTLMKGNIGEIESILELAESKDLNSVYFPSLLPVGRALEDWESMALSPQAQYEVENFLLQKMIGDSFPRISVNRIEHVLSRAMGGDSCDCLTSFTLKIDSSGNVFPCPAAMNPELSLGSIEEVSFAETILERLTDRAPDYRALAQRDHQLCGECSVKGACGARFCEACGVLSEAVLPAARDSACHVLHRHYTGAMDALQKLKLRKGGSGDLEPREEYKRA